MWYNKYRKKILELDELRTKRKTLANASETTLRNMEKIQNESARVAEVAKNSENIIHNLNEEFESQTGLNKIDVAVLFIAICLQCSRIYFINKLTKTEKAGQGNKKEDKLHQLQNKILEKFDNGKKDTPCEYYAPLNQIITGRGVPYDAQAFLGEYQKLFKGANHRFSTLGHDPIVGLIFGTTNILTNTITCINKPLITTNHVVYDALLKNPKIGIPASTILALKNGVQRVDGDMASVVAALIKQIIHIGTDMFTPCGIQLPFANLILDKKTVEKLTKYIGTGDLVKFGTSFKIANFIDTIISVFHSLLFDETRYSSFDMYSIKTRKIIDYSYTIATGSNVIINAIRIYEGDEKAIKDIDYAGLLILLSRIFSDIDFQLKIKEEFILGNFNKMIRGTPLELEEIKLWESLGK